MTRIFRKANNLRNEAHRINSLFLALLVLFLSSFIFLENNCQAGLGLDTYLRDVGAKLTKPEPITQKYCSA